MNNCSGCGANGRIECPICEGRGVNNSNICWTCCGNKFITCPLCAGTCIELARYFTKICPACKNGWGGISTNSYTNEEVCPTCIINNLVCFVCSGQGYSSTSFGDVQCRYCAGKGRFQSRNNLREIIIKCAVNYCNVLLDYLDKKENNPQWIIRDHLYGKNEPLLRDCYPNAKTGK